MPVIPLLPCSSIDDMETFYTALGFERTYRQTKPNPYLAMRRGDIDLYFFGMVGFDPAESYGSCIVYVPDPGTLHRGFPEGLRAAYGKVPVSGIPRMTRPRPRKNVDRLSGFTVIDPGGNWIRIFPMAETVLTVLDNVPLGSEDRDRLAQILAGVEELRRDAARTTSRGVSPA